MRLKRDIRSVTQLKARAAELLQQLNREQPPIITQKGSARAVLLSPESYERMRDAIALLKLLSQSEASLRSGRGIPQREVFARLERKLKNRAGEA
jgi:prevent-host-death family protein